MAWDFSTDAAFEEELAWMRDFVHDEVVPLEALALGAETIAEAIAPLQRRVKDRGLWAAHAPADVGGAGLGQIDLALMHEILGRSVLAPLVFGMSDPDAGNAELLVSGIADSGRDAQRDRWLRPLVEGSIRSAFAMTEPGAGADPSLLATTATREGDQWVLNGHKWFTANGSVADILVVAAVTNPDVHPTQGVSIIVVPADTPGVTVVRDIATMQNPTAESGQVGNYSEIVFRNVCVPYENLVGSEGEGLKLAQQGLGSNRIRHAMTWIGQAQRALDMLCERAVSRYTHGSVLADKQSVQLWVADSLAELTAARLMALHAAWKIDTQGEAAALVEVAMAKVHAAAVLGNVVDRAIQVHGSLGFSADLPLEQMYRAARAARIADGADEVHKVNVARAVLHDYKPVEIPTEYIPARREAAHERFEAEADANDT